MNYRLIVLNSCVSYGFVSVICVNLTLDESVVILCMIIYSFFSYSSLHILIFSYVFVLWIVSHFISILIYSQLAFSFLQFQYSQLNTALEK